MAISILKVAPTAVVVVVSGVCTWPYVWAPDDGSGGPKPAEPPGLSAALLEPAVGADFERNPFQETAGVRLALARSAFARLKGRLADTLKRRKPEVPAEEPEAARRPVERLGVDPAANLVLNATYIQGQKRLAMINGRVYSQGEMLKGIESATGRWKLSEVRPHSVVIDVRGKLMELSYPSPGSSPPGAVARGPSTMTADEGGISEAPPGRPSARPAARAAAAGARRNRGGGQ